MSSPKATAKRYRGITVRPDAYGRPRYLVRVRAAGENRTRTLPTLEEALAWRAQALAAAEGRGEEPARRPPSSAAPAGRATTVLGAAVRLHKGIRDGTIRARDGRPYKPSVGRKYEEALRLLVVPRIGLLPIATLTRGECQRLVDELAAELTPEHGRKALTALRVALRVAERYGELEANPCAGVRVPADPEGEKPARILTPEEASAIVTAAEADDARLQRSFAGPLLALLFGTGLRLGEALALRFGPDGLDLDAGVVRVRATLDRVRDEATGDYPRLAPKSRAGRRDVPLTAEDVRRLRAHRLATGRRDGELVFGGPTGEALSPIPAHRAFKRACWGARVLSGLVDVGPELLEQPTFAAFKRACAEASVPDPLPHPHECRHAFATHALAAGISPHAVAALLGHSDAGLVLRRYGHALPDEVAGAGDALSVWRQARASAAHARHIGRVSAANSLENGP